ncbi:MAG: hypothetical protein ABF542_11485 [Gluconobacter sp.]
MMDVSEMNPGEAVEMLDQAQAGSSDGNITLSRSLFKEMRAHLEKARQLDATNFDLIKKLMR